MSVFFETVSIGIEFRGAPHTRETTKTRKNESTKRFEVAADRQEIRDLPFLA